MHLVVKKNIVIGVKMYGKDILIVCALEQETQGQLEDWNVLYTGVGKVNATYKHLDVDLNGLYEIQFHSFELQRLKSLVYQTSSPQSRYFSSPPSASQSESIVVLDIIPPLGLQSNTSRNRCGV